MTLIEKRNRWMDSFIFAVCLSFNDPTFNLRWGGGGQKRATRQ